MSEKLSLVKGDKVTQIDVGVDIYKAAAENSVSVLSQLDSQYAGDVTPGASASKQILCQAGMTAVAQATTPQEYRAALGNYNVGHAMTGMSASITREGTPASRLLTPAVVLEMAEIQRLDDKKSEIAVFKEQVATTRTIAGNRYEQPLIDLSVPGTAEAGRTSQLTLPNVIGTVTVTSRGGSIPSFGLGLEISDQAMKAFSFDQLALVLNRQRTMHEIRTLSNNMNVLVEGDSDLGMGALPIVKASTFDPAAIDMKTFSQRALMKILRENTVMREPSHIWGDEDTYMAYIERTGRKVAATMYVEDAESGAKLARPINMNVTEPKFWIVEDGVVPRGRLVFLDARYAIEEYINTEANYEATEQLVMRRGTQMRFDYGRVMRRWDDNAWLVVDMVK